MLKVRVWIELADGGTHFDYPVCALRGQVSARVLIGKYLSLIAIFLDIEDNPDCFQEVVLIKWYSVIS